MTQGGKNKSLRKAIIAGVLAAGLLVTGGRGTVYATPTSVTFDTSQTWTVPTGITSVTVEAWGGGGAGAGNASNTQYGEGGGGGGAYAKKSNIPVVPNTGYTVNVGLGGTIAQGAGGTGGDSYFINTSTILAKGGFGGSGDTGGGGGAASSCVGDTRIDGGRGGNGGGATFGSGGGGGAAGDTNPGGQGGDGQNGPVAGTAGTGGSTGGGNGAAGLAAENDGQQGVAPGGGGSGAYIPDATNHSGGAGAAGRVIITYEFPPNYGKPASSSYTLDAYQFGSGGSRDSYSAAYRIYGVSGQVETEKTASANFASGNGLTYIQTADVPVAPTLSNPTSSYNKLFLVLNTGSDPADTTYAVAISPDNFATITRYIQADGTSGTNPVWQTKTVWGDSGFYLTGLDGGTTYTVKISAMQGSFTQSPWGPTAQAATVNPTFSFSLSPNSISIGQLTPGTVVTSPSSVTAQVTTNGASGAVIYVYGTNSGLLSSRAGYTITTVSNDLSGVVEGYGIRGTGTSETSGVPMEILSPYDGINDTVGAVNTSKQILFDSSGQPVTGGSGTFVLKAKAGATAKAATDYTDILTVIASATF